MIGSICTPALIYLIFSISQVLIDTVKGFFNTALVKIILTIVFTFILNYLCNAGFRNFILDNSFYPIYSDDGDSYIIIIRVQFRSKIREEW